MKSKIPESLNSKLLSEVLGEEVRIDFSHTEGLEYDISIYNDSMRTVINIQHLGNLCKEWAFKKGCQIRSSYMSFLFDEPFAEVIVQVGIDEFGEKQLMIVTNQGEKTEVETIFACCNWIMDNTDRLAEIEENRLEGI